MQKEKMSYNQRPMQSESYFQEFFFQKKTAKA